MSLGLQEITIGAVGAGNGDKGWQFSEKINENFAAVDGALEDAEMKAFVISCTDENQTIEERLQALDSNNRFRSFRIPFSFALTEVRASIEGTEGDDVVLDITENGESIFGSGDKLTIPAGSETSVGSSPGVDVQYVILQDNNKIQVFLDSAPSGGTAVCLTVTLIGYVIWTSG
jgi:hypothetical protein